VLQTPPGQTSSSQCLLWLIAHRHWTDCLRMQMPAACIQEKSVHLILNAAVEVLSLQSLTMDQHYKNLYLDGADKNCKEPWTDTNI